MSLPPQDGNPSVPPEQDEITSPLHAAMKMADLVRSSLHQATTASDSDENPDFRFTPGVLEGAAAGVVSLLVLTPVRSLVLRATGNRLGMLPDLIVTTSQIMISANAALYYGTLYGGYHYLQTFSQIPVHAASKTVDSICTQSLQRFGVHYDEVTTELPKLPDSSSSWNPDEIVLAEFSKAMKLCRERDLLAQRKEETNAPERVKDGKMTFWRRK